MMDQNRKDEDGSEFAHALISTANSIVSASLAAGFNLLAREIIKAISENPNITALEIMKVMDTCRKKNKIPIGAGS